MPSNSKNEIRFGVHFDTDVSGLQKAKKAIHQIANGAVNKGNFGGAQKDLKEIIATAEQLDKILDEAFNVNLNSFNTDKFNQGLKNAGLSVQDVYNQLSKIGPLGHQAFSQMSTSVLTSNLHLKETHSIIDSMGKTMMNTVKWSVASSVMNTFTGSVQQAFQYVKSLDSALTDIRIVTGASTEQMAQFADQANRAASELGRSTMDYTKAALTFYQQGLGEEDVAARTEAVMKAQNITGAGAEMADYLTAVWNGYKVANEEAELYVDKLAAVADSSASNMSELAIAMSKVASTANTMGVDVDSLNAQIATIVATTRQAPESVGNALKTIYTRINDISTGAEGAQISLGTYSSRLAEMGVNVLDANGRLRDTGEVIEEIGGKWQTFSKQQQIAIARTMAGQRQINNMTALFDNWDKYINLVNVSMESQGTTMEKNSIYMESLQAHLNQLGAASEKLKSSMINADSFKGLVDVGTSLVKVFAGFIDSIGGGGNALLMLGSTATSVFSGTISREISKMVTNTQNARENIRQLQSDIELTRNYKVAGFGDTETKLSQAAVEKVITAKEAIQGLYGMMSNEEINSYNNLVKKVGELQTEADALQDVYDKAKDLANLEEQGIHFFGEDDFLLSDQFIKKLQQVKNQINNISTEGGVDLLGGLVEGYYGEIENSLGEKFIKKFEAGKDLKEVVSQAQDSEEALEKAKRQLTLFINQLSKVNSEEAEKLRQKLGLVKNELTEAEKRAEAFKRQIQQTSSIRTFVNLAGGIGQVASAMRSLSSLTKTWEDETLSTGEKALATLTALGTVGTIGFTGIQKVIDSSTVLLGKFASALTGTTVKVSGLGSAITAVRLALGPVGIAIGIISAATAVGLAIWDHFTMSVEEAEKALEKFKEKEKETAQSNKEYAEKIKNIEEVSEEYEKLAQKANAANFDSNIDSLTQAERARYNQIKELFASYNDGVIEGYRTQTGQIYLKNDAIKQTLDLMAQQKQANIDATYGGDAFKTAQKARQTRREEILQQIPQLQSKTFKEEVYSTDIIPSADQWIQGLEIATNHNQDKVDYLRQKIIDVQSTEYENQQQEIEALINLNEELVTRGYANFRDTYLPLLKDISSEAMKFYANQEITLRNLRDELSTLDLDTSFVYGHLSSSDEGMLGESLEEAYLAYGDTYQTRLLEQIEKQKKLLGENASAHQVALAVVESIHNLLNERGDKNLNYLSKEVQEQLAARAKDTYSETLESQKGTIQQVQQAVQTGVRQAINGTDLQDMLLNGSGEEQTLAARIASSIFDTEEVDVQWDSYSKRFVTKVKSKTKELTELIQGEESLPSFKGSSFIGNYLEENFDTEEINSIINNFPDINQRFKEKVDAGEIAPTFSNWIKEVEKFLEELERVNNSSDKINFISLLNRQQAGQTLSTEELEKLHQYMQRFGDEYAEEMEILSNKYAIGTEAFGNEIKSITDKTIAELEQLKADGGQVASSQIMELITDLESYNKVIGSNLFSSDLLVQAQGRLAQIYPQLKDEYDNLLSAYQSGNREELSLALKAWNAAKALLGLEEQSEYTAQEVENLVESLEYANSALLGLFDNSEEAAKALLNFKKYFSEIKNIVSDGIIDDDEQLKLQESIYKAFNLENLGIDSKQFKNVFKEIPIEDLIDAFSKEGAELEEAVTELLINAFEKFSGIKIDKTALKEQVVALVPQIKQEMEQALQQNPVEIAFKAMGLDDAQINSFLGKISQVKTWYLDAAQSIWTLSQEFLKETEFYAAAQQRLVSISFDALAQAQAESLESLRIKSLQSETADTYTKLEEQIKSSISSSTIALISSMENLQLASRMGIITNEDYTLSLMKLASNYDSCKTELENYYQALRSNNEDLINAAAGTLQMSIRAGELAQDLGVQAETIEYVANELAKYDEALQQNAELAIQAAEYNIRLNRGFEELSENAEKYNQLMQEMANADLSEGQLFSVNEDDLKLLDNLKDSVADVLNVRKELISDDWLQQHYNDVMKAIENEGQGIAELQELASQEYLINLGIDDALFEDQINTTKQEFFDAMAEIAQSGEQIDLESSLGQQLQSVAQLLYQLTGDAALVQDWFRGFGILIDTSEAQDAVGELEGALEALPEAADNAARGSGINAEATTQVTNTDTTSYVPTQEYQQTNPVVGIFHYPNLSYHSVDSPLGNLIGGYVIGQDAELPVSVPQFRPVNNAQPVEGKNQHVASSLKVESAKGIGSGGNITHKNRTRNNRAGGGGRKGGGGGGNKGKTPSPAKKEKGITPTKPTKPTKAQRDPYHEVNKQLERQSEELEKINKLQEKSVNRDRLKLLEDENLAIQQQIDLLKKKNKIAGDEYLKAQKGLAAALGKGFVIQYDQDGYIANYNAVNKKIADDYNKEVAAADKKLQQAEKNYNNFIENKYNKAKNADEQKALETEKDRYKTAVDTAKKERDAAKERAEERKKEKEDYVKTIEETAALRKDIKKQIREAIEQQVENNIEKFKIQVDLKIDSGELAREWLNFEKKFVRRLKDDDFVNQAKANIDEIVSYFNSGQLEATKNQIDEIRKEIASMESGGVSSIFGNGKDPAFNNMAAAQERLKELISQYQNDLLAVQELQQKVQQNYLKTIDKVKDKFDEHIEQYELVNDLIEHNVKLTELLYGDKGYDVLDKYYTLQHQNNQKTLESLRQQQDFWATRMNQETKGSDAWKEYKKNWEEVTKDLTSQVEDMIDNLATIFENKLSAAIERINNKLTNGLGVDYLNEEWDAINNYDDEFLDTVNSKFGIEDVERTYQSAIDDLAGNPKQQEKINSLMRDQLKILKEKDKLTQYDIDRAKALLEVEQARMALEDARNAKTKMRLRRDSQGNYTYQYVADEEKLGQLQDALAKAQNDLYNQDKEHYKQNLNKLYDTYKDYIEKMKDLTAEYNATQDEEERARIKKRMELLQYATKEMMNGFTEDNVYALQYLGQSFFDAMGIDPSRYTAEEQMEIMNQNIPQMQSNIQDLANTIVGEGGILNATSSMMKEFNQATQEYDEGVSTVLETVGTSVSEVAQAVDENGEALDKNIQQAESFVEANEKVIESCQNEINAIRELIGWMEQYLNEVLKTAEAIKTLSASYDTLFSLNGSDLTANQTTGQTFVNGVAVNGTASEGIRFTGNIEEDKTVVQTNINKVLEEYMNYLKSMSKTGAVKFAEGGYTGVWSGDERLAYLHQKELVLNPQDTSNILAAVEAVRQITEMMSLQGELINLRANMSNAMDGIGAQLLDQNVHIEANFPNVTQHTEIEEAFKNLVNVASMKASKYRD